jgi:hypothetical protein
VHRSWWSLKLLTVAALLLAMIVYVPNSSIAHWAAASRLIALMWHTFTGLVVLDIAYSLHSWLLGKVRQCSVCYSICARLCSLYTRCSCDASECDDSSLWTDYAYVNAMQAVEADNNGSRGSGVVAVTWRLLYVVLCAM